MVVEILAHDFDFTVGALTANVALAGGTDYATGLLASFLMKKVEFSHFLETPDAEDLLIIGMARGDATITEIKTAIEKKQVERSKKDQANTRDILWETVRHISANSAADSMAIHQVVSLGGGKGIPFEEGDGWQWFIYNKGLNDQVAGAFVRSNATYYGVWL